MLQREMSYQKDLLQKENFETSQIEALFPKVGLALPTLGFSIISYKRSPVGFGQLCRDGSLRCQC